MSSMHKALCSILNTHAHICMQREGARKRWREGRSEQGRGRGRRRVNKGPQKSRQYSLYISEGRWFIFY